MNIQEEAVAEVKLYKMYEDLMEEDRKYEQANPHSPEWLAYIEKQGEQSAVRKCQTLIDFLVHEKKADINLLQQFLEASDELGVQPVCQHLLKCDTHGYKTDAAIRMWLISDLELMYQLMQKGLPDYPVGLGKKSAE